MELGEANHQPTTGRPPHFGRQALSICKRQLFVHYLPDMDAVEQRERILEDARLAEPAGRQIRLAPHREAVLIYRARGFSYEDIAAALNRLGLKSSPTNVGLFCRRHFRKADIQRKRLELESTATASGTPVTPSSAPRVPSFITGRRGGRS